MKGNKLCVGGHGKVDKQGWIVRMRQQKTIRAWTFLHTHQRKTRGKQVTPYKPWHYRIHLCMHTKLELGFDLVICFTLFS